MIDFCPIELPFVLLESRKALPRVAAIYFCLDSSNQVVYIGETADLFLRWKNHDKLWRCRQLKVNKIAYWQAPTIGNRQQAAFYRRSLERPLVQLFRPILNNHLKDSKLRLAQKVEETLGVEFGVQFND